MSAAKQGDRINNYLLEERVGMGSFGEVWRARHHVLDQLVAVKILTDPQYVRNFRQEGVVAHGLHHPNIVRVYDIDPYADLPYLIMEFVQGPPLRQVLDQHPEGLPVEAAVEIMRGVLGGLVCAHHVGLVHRDVKPANILLTCPPEEVDKIRHHQVKVVDFGLGRTGGMTTGSILQSGSMLTEEGRSIAGTLAYMSPEQKIGQDLDGRSDLYSCGIVLFEMLTGDRPAGNELPSTLRPGLPGYLDEVFKRSYTRLERRYGGAAEMLEQLTPAHASAPRTAAAVPPAVGAARQACPSCRKAVAAEDQFCIHCGRQLVEAVPRCYRCHAFVGRTDNFCILCGADLRVKDVDANLPG